MKINGADLALTSSREAILQVERTESLRTWTGALPVGMDSSQAPPPPVQDTFSLSLEARRLTQPMAPEEPVDLDSEDPRLKILRLLLEKLTGLHIDVLKPEELETSSQQQATVSRATQAAATSTPQAGFGMIYQYRESVLDAETTSFQASGSLTTTDGRAYAFDARLEMSRTWSSEVFVEVRAGDAALVDPLVLNLDGQPGRFIEGVSFKLDLNGDGIVDVMPWPGLGSFLANDRDGNGTVTNGSELYGPTTGDGFAELARADSDGNQWIDEADPVFMDLRIWHRDPAADPKLYTLQQMGIGAIALQRVTTDFTVRDAFNRTQGQVRTTGLFVKEDGTVGTMQQVDLATRPADA